MGKAEYNWPQNIVRKMKSGCQTLFEWLRLLLAGSPWASALRASLFTSFKPRRDFLISLYKNQIKHFAILDV